MRNFIEILRKKLELDNPDRYINGYYQLSKRQKRLWVIALFLGAWVFAIVRLVAFGKASSPYITLISSVLGALLNMLISLFSAYIFSGRVVFFKSDILPDKKITKIIMYQLWTLFLILVMVSVVFQIKLPFPFLH